MFLSNFETGVCSSSERLARFLSRCRNPADAERGAPKAQQPFAGKIQPFDILLALLDFF